ncbi:MAG: hypothetical protein E7034_03515 [Akkermansiaceae bacterium]|nr:hypothetical protein [Akkermansiaceae bacterium]
MADNSNPGKQALMIGAVLGIAAAAYGGYFMSTAETQVPGTSVSDGKKDSGLTAEAVALRDSVKQDRTVKDCAPEGAVINGKPRLAPMLFTTELWQITVDSAKKTTIIDIYDPKAANIHQDVPNSWFLANGLSDVLGRSDALSLDSDSDGFTNADEFAAKTKPTDAASYPALVQQGAAPRMEVVKVETARAFIAVDNMFASEPNPASVGLRVFAKSSDTSPICKKTLKPGESFGLTKEGPQTRFTVVGFEKKDFPDFTGAMSPENVVRVRDNETAAADKEFVIRAGKSTSPKEKGTPNEKGRQINDTTATLRVTAGSALGKPEGTMKVQLYSSFDIPGGNSSGEKMSATLETVDASGSVNIRLNGAESPINVPVASKK